MNLNVLVCACFLNAPAPLVEAPKPPPAAKEPSQEVKHLQEKILALEKQLGSRDLKALALMQRARDEELAAIENDLFILRTDIKGSVDKEYIGSRLAMEQRLVVEVHSLKA